MTSSYLQHANIVLPSLHNGRFLSFDVHYAPTESFQPLPVIIFIHGFNGFKDWGHFPLIADYFAEQGLMCIRLNLSHNGTTPEQPTEIVDLEAYSMDKFSYDLDDIGTLLAFLRHGEGTQHWQCLPDIQRIFLIGHSRGGALALLKATEDSDIAGVITWASIAGTTHFWQGENVAKVLKDGVVWVLNSRTKQKLPLCKAYYDDLIENAARLDLKQRLPHLKIPVLLIHGEADNVVPPERLKDLQYLLPHSQSYLVPEANHTFGGKHPFAESVLPPHTQIIVEQSYQFIHEVCSKSGYFVA